MLKSTSSNMSSVSKFSMKSQVLIAHQDETIANQDGTIAAMRSAMISAGLNTDLVVPLRTGPGSGSESGVMDVDVNVISNSKKRMPSGSPDGKECLAG